VEVPGRLREVEAGKQGSKSKVALGLFGLGRSAPQNATSPPPLRSDDLPFFPYLRSGL
jgi:hypothetical protein